MSVKKSNIDKSSKVSFMLSYFQEKQNIKPFIETKYVDNEFIPCQFDLYRVNISDNRISQQKKDL